MSHEPVRSKVAVFSLTAGALALIATCSVLLPPVQRAVRNAPAVFAVIGLIAVVGLLSGIAALVVVAAGRPRVVGMGYAGAGTLMSIAALVPFMISLAAARDAARISSCRINMKQIGYALQRYSSDHDEWFPDSLDALMEYVPGDTERLRRCPGNPEDPDAYIQLKGVRAAHPSWMVLVYEKEGNHAGGRNVLYVGDHVSWRTEKGFQEDLSRTKEYLEKRRRKAP